MRKIFSPMFCFAAILALTASCIVWWQTNRITPLIDYSYQVENAYRIFQGQTPYRDFFLVVSPATYYVMAALMYLTGGYSHMIQVYYVMFIACSTILFTYGILRLLNKDIAFNVVLLIPLVFSGQSIYAYPLYDPNVALSMLVALFGLLYIRINKPTSDGWYIAAGILSAIPAFFKQNTGAIFFISVLVVFLLSALIERNKKSIHACIVFGFGGVIAYSLFSLWFISHNAFDQFIYQTFTFPSSSKNPADAIRIIIQQYKDYGVFISQHLTEIASYFGLMIIVIVLSKMIRKTVRRNVVILLGHFLIFSLTLVWLIRFMQLSDPLLQYNTYILVFWCTLTFISLVSCLQNYIQKTSKNDPVTILLPVILIASTHATFFSHGIVGSSYCMWPLAIILTGYVTKYLNRIAPVIHWKFVIAFFVLFLAMFLRQAIQNDYALSYVDHDGLVTRVKSKQLTGLSLSGSWIEQFEFMESYVQQTIPMKDKVAFLPGEDPFFATTRRVNPLKFSLLHAGVYSLRPSLIISELLEKKVDWVVVKKSYQTHPWLWISNIDEITYYMKQYYKVAKTLPNYDIYIRK